jgi:hypothetical protein
MKLAVSEGRWFASMSVEPDSDIGQLLDQIVVVENPHFSRPHFVPRFVQTGGQRTVTRLGSIGRAPLSRSSDLRLRHPRLIAGVARRAHRPRISCQTGDRDLLRDRPELGAPTPRRSRSAAELPPNQRLPRDIPPRTRSVGETMRVQVQGIISARSARFPCHRAQYLQYTFSLRRHLAFGSTLRASRVEAANRWQASVVAR